MIARCPWHHWHHWHHEEFVPTGWSDEVRHYQFVSYTQPCHFMVYTLYTVCILYVHVYTVFAPLVNSGFDNLTIQDLFIAAFSTRIGRSSSTVLTGERNVLVHRRFAVWQRNIGKLWPCCKPIHSFSGRRPRQGNRAVIATPMAQETSPKKPRRS